MHNITWQAQRIDYQQCVDIFGFIDFGNPRSDAFHVVQPVEFVLKERPRFAPAEGPSIRLANESAQTLFQALWDAGLRPHSGEGSTAEVNALKKHIAFAQTVAERLLPHIPGSPDAK